MGRREKSKNMKSQIIYKPRYSYTDEPDEQGRWLREVSFNNLNIANISMQIFKNGIIKYLLVSNFPIDDNIGSHYINSFDIYEEAQSKIESLWTEFKLKVKK